MDQNKPLPYVQFINLMKQGLSRWPVFILFVVLLPACGGGGSETDGDDNPQDTGVAEERFLDATEDEDVDVTLTINLADSTAKSASSQTRSARPPLLTGSTAIGSRAPQLYEFTSVTPSGRSIKGVIYGLGVNVIDEATGELAADDFAASIRNKEMRLRARVKKVNGEFVLVGNATAIPGSGSLAVEQRFQDIAWTVIAVESGTTLTGPEPGRVFHYYGDANTRAVCNGNLVSGMFRVANTTRVVGTLIGMLEGGKVCSTATFAGNAKLSMDAIVVDTHIGPLLSSEGFLAPKGKFANAVETFGLGIAEQLSGEGDIVDVKTNDTTRILDPEAAQEFVGFYEAYQALVFKSLKGSLAGLQEGDFIVSKPRPKMPNGFLRKVFQIQDINGYVAVRTENALISDILESANIHVNRSYSAADVAEANAWFGVEEAPIAAGNTGTVRMLRKQADGGDLININVNKVVFDADGDNATTTDQIKVTGSLSFTPGVVIDLVCSGTLCSTPDFTAKFVLEEATTAKLVGSIQKTLHKSYNLPPSIWLPPITVGPLVFTPKFVIQLNVDGTVSASITYEATQSFTLEAGVDYTPADGWGTISEFDKDFDNSPPEYEGAIDAKAELALRGEFKLYGLAGVFADLGGYVQFQAQYPSDPLWTLFGGFGSSVGVDLDVIVLQAEYAWDIFDKRWEISHAPNTPPDPPALSQPYPKTATKTDGWRIGDPIEKFVQVDAEVTFDAVAWDAQRGESGSLIHLFSDLEQGTGLDGEIGTMKSGDQSGFTYTFKNTGIHTISAYATDEGNTGLTSETSTMQVEVIDSAALRRDPYPPTFTIDRPEVVFDGQSAVIVLTVEDTRNVQTNPLNVVVDWAVDGEHIRSTGGDASNPMQHSFTHSYSSTAQSAGIARSISVVSGTDSTQVQADPSAAEIRTASQIDVTIQYEYEGSGYDPYILSKHTSVKIAPTQGGNIIATLSPITKTFTTDNRPVGIKEEVIYTVDVSYPDQCNSLLWSSSDERDAIGSTPVGGIVAADGTASISLLFYSEGTRYITAELVDPDCANVASKVETRVQRYFSGGTSPNSANLQFNPDAAN